MRGDRMFGTIPGLLREAVARYGTAIAIEDGDEHISFEALAGLVHRAARGL